MPLSLKISLKKGMAHGWHKTAEFLLTTQSRAEFNSD